MSINFRLHATLWESSAKLKTPSPALIRHIKHSFSFEINLIIRYAKGSNWKFQLPITLCHCQLFLPDIGPEVNIQEGFQIRGTCMMVSSLLATTAHSFCSLRRGSEISLFTFCLRPAQSAHPSMSNSPNESLIQGKDYKFPKLYSFHIDQWDFWSQGSVASISQASDWKWLHSSRWNLLQTQMCGHMDVSAQQPGMVWSLNFSVEYLSLHRPCQRHNHPSGLHDMVKPRPEERLWKKKFHSAQAHASARDLPSNEQIAAAELYSVDSFGLKRAQSVESFPCSFWVSSR